MSGIEETPPRESEGSKDTSSKSKDVTGGGVSRLPGKT